MIPSLYNIPPFLRQRLRRYEVNGFVFHTVLVEKGTFMMGGNDSEADKYEKPVHRVSIIQDYEMGIHPVTQALWRAVTGSDRPEVCFVGDNQPVVQVSWEDICGFGGFLEKLNDMLITRPQGDEAGVFALPTEAQWEYAARGGLYRDCSNPLYAGSNRLSEVGWYEKNSGEETQIVGAKQPNVLGLYDMSGNVWEWIADDWYDNFDYAADDDRAWIETPRSLVRVHRGGSGFNPSKSCRLVYRAYRLSGARSMNVGFRLVRTSSPPI
jgi:formylglycine-generating enzyme